MLNIHLDLFEDWLRNKNLKDRTIENYTYYFNKFPDNKFNQESVSRFLSLKQHRNSIARSFLVNIRKFMLKNYKELKINDDYYKEISEVELPKLSGRSKKRLIKPLSEEQIYLLEKYLQEEKYKVMLLLNYHAGLRLGELIKLNINSFNWDEWKKDTTKQGECRVLGKGDKEGIAIIPPFLMERIAKHIRSRTSKFKGINSSLFNRSGRLWQMKLLQAGIDAGITPLDTEGRPIASETVHPHRLRHSYASYLLKVKKMDIRYIQEALRHSSIQSTQIYTNIDKEDLKKELLKES